MEFGRQKRRISRLHKGESNILANRTHEMSSGSVSRPQQMIDSLRPESSTTSVILHSESISRLQPGGVSILL